MSKKSVTTEQRFEMRRFENGEIVEVRTLAPSTDSDEAMDIVREERTWYEDDGAVEVRLFLIETKVTREVTAEAEIRVG